MKRLREHGSFILRPTAPFQFDGTVYKPSHFPSPLEAWEPGRYWHALRLDGGLYGVRLCNRGTVAKPSLGVSIFSDREIASGQLEAIRRELIWRFDLEADLRRFLKAGQDHLRFRPAFRRLRGMRASCTYNLYELLVTCVLLQNATVRRTVQMTGALLDAFGTELQFDSKQIFAM
jgi:3-methyladenine DNA glycosylase/8-oxoguanine DNA glycosylase